MGVPQRNLSGRRFAVIGGGIVGLALSRRLAQLGGGVVLIDRRRLGEGATGASAGVLKSPRGGKSDLQRLLLAAQGGYEGFVRELESETGMEIEFRRSGFVDVALTENEERDIRKSLAAYLSRGIDAAWIDRKALLGLAPGVSHLARGALSLSGTAWAHPGDLVAALRCGLERSGVEVIEGRSASLLRRREGSWDVLLDGPDGVALEGREVIVAAGAWTEEILGKAGLVPAAPIRPIRGQMVEAEHPFPLTPVLHHGEIYVIPRPGGMVWIGATVEDVGFDERTTDEGARFLLHGAREVLPGLGGIRRQWAGLRPKLLRRGGPLIGEGDPPVIAGHYRSGIHLGPLTAHILASRLVGEPRPMLGPFQLEG